MKIDVFNHLFPRRFFDQYIDCPGAPKDIGKRVRAMPTVVDLDARFRVMDEFGEYVQLISLPSPPIEKLAAPDKSPGLARLATGPRTIAPRRPSIAEPCGTCRGRPTVPFTLAIPSMAGEY